MNNDFNKNTRTLIVSFVFALMVMIPLRFLEIAPSVSEPVVLGDSTEIIEQTEITDNDCLPNEYVDQVVSGLSDPSEIENFEVRRCL